MSRVLLFVADERGWPKCVGQQTAKWPIGGEYITARAARIRDASDRWWLVECENAEAGRRLIDSMTLPGETGVVVAHDRDGSTIARGRILASGGKERSAT